MGVYKKPTSLSSKQVIAKKTEAQAVTRQEPTLHWPADKEINLLAPFRHPLSLLNLMKTNS